MSDTSTTFGSWKDRITYLAAEGQLIVLGVMVSVGAAIVWFRPSMPGIPPIVWGWMAALLLLGPPLLALFITGVRWLRKRNMVEVYHVNGVTDILKKYYVEPEIWAEKNVQGAKPYPVNGGSSWAVREFEWLDDVEEMNVRGVWLSETSDTELLTSKSHMEAIYSKLTESHIALNILRDSVSEFGADIQRALVNSMAEAREKGKLMDKTAVKEVFESFEKEASGKDDEGLPTLEADDVMLPGGDVVGETAGDALGSIGPTETPTAPAATDGGSDQ